ncbi:MAG: NHLP leader peptide family RiPP precursor [Potamolinea sp.]
MNPEIKQAISEALAKRSEFERQLIIKAWEDEAFRQELLANPKAVYAKEAGRELPANLQIEVVDEPAGVIKIVLPPNPVPPQVEEELSDEELEAVAGGKPSVTVRGQIEAVQ